MWDLHAALEQIVIRFDRRLTALESDPTPTPQPPAATPVCLGCKNPLTVRQNQEPEYEVGLLTGDYEITCEECGWILYVPANDEDEARAQYARITGQAATVPAAAVDALKILTGIADELEAHPYRNTAVTVSQLRDQIAVIVRALAVSL